MAVRIFWALLLTVTGLLLLWLLGKGSYRNKSLDYFPIIPAGKPDQINRLDDTLMENADMVSEGSLYGVQYYNEIAEEYN